MQTINEIFKAYGPEYIKSFGASMPNNHKKVIDAIISCRTKACGVVVYECTKCGTMHTTFRSCGNRHCPQCQNHKIKLWVKKQMKNQLPVHYFTCDLQVMTTFTMPQQIRRFIRSNQKIAYSAMFKASSGALKKLIPDSKYVGGDVPGFFGALHTWGRQLQYHPHIHYIMPGGAVTKDDGKWHSSRKDFYLPVKALSKIFRSKFYNEIKKAGLLSCIPSHVWEIDWNVNCRAMGNSTNGIKYLSPYVFKVAISDNRIIKVENRRVYFRYKKTKSNRFRTMQLNVMEFIRRFLQHVLPTGFMKIRYYGFLHPSSSISLGMVRRALKEVLDADFMEEEPEAETKPEILCPNCGGKLKYYYSILPYQMIPADTG
jgi:DNA-directed RNA polymerase subunit RPC12/RpoP